MTLEYCTLFDANYLAQGLALHESIDRHHRDYRLHILALCERSYTTLKGLSLPNIVLYSTANVRNPVPHTRPKMDSLEHACTFKPGFMLCVLQEAEYIVYIDADSYFFNTGQHVIGPLRADRSIPVAITPHRFAPAHVRFAVNGNYNAGCIYADRTGIPCLKSWAHRCIAERKGRMTDQQLLNDWPKQWWAHVIEHKGFNLAPWNQEQYTYDVRRGVLFVDTDPVICYHFHQGMEPAYGLIPFVRDYLYKPYQEALDRAKKVVQS